MKNFAAIRKTFDKYNLISALHSFKLNENSVYNKLLPPLMLLNEKNHETIVI